MNDTTSPAVLKLRWEAAKRFLDKMQAAHDNGQVSFGAVVAADLAECDAYNEWQFAEQAAQKQAA